MTKLNETTINNLKALYNSLKQNLLDVSKDLEIKYKKRGEIETSIEILKERRGEENKELESLNGKKGNIERYIEAQKELLKGKEEDIDNKERETRDKEREANRMISERQYELRDIESGIVCHIDEKKSLEVQIEGKKEEYNILFASVGKLDRKRQGEIDDLNKEIKLLQDKVDFLKSNEIERGKHVEDLDKDIIEKQKVLNNSGKGLALERQDLRRERNDLEILRIRLREAYKLIGRNLK